MHLLAGGSPLQKFIGGVKLATGELEDTLLMMRLPWALSPRFCCSFGYSHPYIGRQRRDNSPPAPLTPLSTCDPAKKEQYETTDADHRRGRGKPQR